MMGGPESEVLNARTGKPVTAAPYGYKVGCRFADSEGVRQIDGHRVRWSSRVLNWSMDVAIRDWEGVAVGGSTQRVAGLNLGDRALSGTIPLDLGLLHGLETLDLSDNLLTGEIPTTLGDLSILLSLNLSGNSLSGCIPATIRNVMSSDLGELDMPYCDVLPGRLELSPGELNQQFDPYRIDYTAVSDVSRITASSTNHFGASLSFLDNLSRPLTDDEGEAPGFQIDLKAGVTSVRVRAESSGRLAELTHTVLVAEGGPFRRYDADENKTIDGEEVLEAVRDYFDGGLTGDQVICMVQLYFF